MSTMSMRQNENNELSFQREYYQDFSESSFLSERDMVILNMYNNGHSTYQIADAMELNRHTVSKVLKDNNISTRITADYHKFKHQDIIDLFHKGKSKKEIAVELELTDYTVRKVLEDNGLILNKKDRETISISRYIQMKNKGYDNESIAIFLEMNTKQLNKLVRNSGVNVTAVRHRTKEIESLPDIILLRLQGGTLKEISLKYEIDIVVLLEILYEFGLSKTKRKLIDKQL